MHREYWQKREARIKAEMGWRYYLWRVYMWLLLLPDEILFRLQMGIARLRE